MAQPAPGDGDEGATRGTLRTRISWQSPPSLASAPDTPFRAEPMSLGFPRNRRTRARSIISILCTVVSLPLFRLAIK